MARLARIPVMRQTWANIVWCHWRVAPDVVADLLPDGLVPDLFDGDAWVGLVPFSMRDLRLPGPLRWISRLVHVGDFGEVNVRTYVRGPDGGTGVWFFSLDADAWLAVRTANVAFGLPYRHATTNSRQSGNELSWTDHVKGSGSRAALTVVASPDPPRVAQPGLETFLVERYALYTLRGRRLYRGELRHQPWRVRTAVLVSIDAGVVNDAGLTPQGVAHVLVGEPVDVTVYPLTRVRLADKVVPVQ